MKEWSSSNRAFPSSSPGLPLSLMPRTGRPKSSLPLLPVAKQVERLADKLTMEQMADYFGLCDGTLRKRFQESPELLAAYKKGRGKTVNAVAEKLISMAKSGNLTAIIFYLKTQARWQEKSETDLSSIDLSGCSDEELERIAAGEPISKVLANRELGRRS